MTQQYETPLSSRYASKYMLELFSADTRYRTWRRLWVALARAEMELGLPVTQAQVDELAAHIEDIDYEVVRQREKEVFFVVLLFGDELLVSFADQIKLFSVDEHVLREQRFGLIAQNT